MWWVAIVAKQAAYCLQAFCTNLACSEHCVMFITTKTLSPNASARHASCCIAVSLGYQLIPLSNCLLLIRQYKMYPRQKEGHMSYCVMLK